MYQIIHYDSKGHQKEVVNCDRLIEVEWQLALLEKTLSLHERIEVIDGVKIIYQKEKIQ